MFAKLNNFSAYIAHDSYVGLALAACIVAVAVYLLLTDQDMYVPIGLLPVFWFSWIGAPLILSIISIFVTENTYHSYLALPILASFFAGILIILWGLGNIVFNVPNE